MKKVYMQPLTEVVKINAEQLICQSIAGVKTLDDLDIASEEYGGGTPDFKEDYLNVDDLW